MKKIILLMALSGLLLVGCSEEKHSVGKNEKTEPYVYSKYSTEIDILNELSNVWTASALAMLEAVLTPSVVEEKIINGIEKLGVNERITLNIDSDDARYIQSLIDSRLNEADETILKIHDALESDDPDVMLPKLFNYQFLGHYYETDAYISLSVFNIRFAWGTDFYNEIRNSYVFSKTDGHLMSPGEILSVAGYTLDDIETMLRAESEKIEPNQMGGKYIYEPDYLDTRTSIAVRENEEMDDYQNTLYLNYTSPFMLMEQGLVVNTEQNLPNGLELKIAGPYYVMKYKTPLDVSDKIKKTDLNKPWIDAQLIDTEYSDELNQSQRVFVNIDSDDARLLNRMFDHQMASYNLYGYERELNTVNQTEDTVSFSLIDTCYRKEENYKIDYKEFQSYTIDLKTGFAMSWQQILNSADTNLDAVLEKTALYFKSNPYSMKDTIIEFSKDVSRADLRYDGEKLMLAAGNPFQINQDGTLGIFVQAGYNGKTLEILTVK